MDSLCFFLGQCRWRDETESLEQSQLGSWFLPALSEVRHLSSPGFLISSSEGHSLLLCPVRELKGGGSSVRILLMWEFCCRQNLEEQMKGSSGPVRPGSLGSAQWGITILGASLPHQGGKRRLCFINCWLLNADMVSRFLHFISNSFPRTW